MYRRLIVALTRQKKVQVRQNIARERSGKRKASWRSFVFLKAEEKEKNHSLLYQSYDKSSLVVLWDRRRYRSRTLDMEEKLGIRVTDRICFFYFLRDLPEPDPE